MTNQTPGQDQARINAVTWTNGRNLVTGAQVAGILGAMVTTFLLYAPLAGAAFTGSVTINGLLASVVAHNNSGLSSVSTAYFSSVQRDGYAAAGDSPAVTFTGASTCPYNGGVADGGSCVASSDGRFWVIAMPDVASATLWGVTCDGATITTTALQNAINDAPSTTLPSGKTCIAGNLILPGLHKINLNGATLQAAPGSLWTLWITGVQTQAWGGYVTDPNYYNKVSTTLTSDVAPGVGVVPVTNAASFANGMPVVYPMKSGIYAQTKIKPVAGISANNITLVDPIPASATAATVSAGGAGCAVNDSLVVQGGTGAPVTLAVTGISTTATASFTGSVASGVLTVTSTPTGTLAVGQTLSTGGAITGEITGAGGIGTYATSAPNTASTTITSTVTGSVSSVQIAAPGLYASINPPASPASAVSHNDPGCQGVTVNLTLQGAANGATFEGTWGTLVADQISYGGFHDISLGVTFSGMGVYDRSTGGGLTNNNNFNNVVINAAGDFGLFVGAGVNTSNFTNFIGYGYTHGASAYGTVGLYREYEQPTTTAPSGGNHFTNFTTLGYETGTILRKANLDFFDSGFTNDTIRNYALILDGAYNETFSSSVWDAFTGNEINAATAGYGIGVYVGKYSSVGDATPTPSLSDTFVAQVGGTNAADFYFSDWSGDGTGTSSAVAISAGGSLPALRISGKSAGFVTAAPLYSGTSGATTYGAGTVGYVGMAGASTSEINIATPANRTQVITGFGCQTLVTPGSGQTYTCNFRATGVTFGSCTIPNGQTSCVFSGPGLALFTNQVVDLQFVPSASAAATQARFWVSGL